MKIDGAIKELQDNKASLINGKVPSEELPSYVDDVLEFELYAQLPSIGEHGKIYVIYGDATDLNGQYRWTGTVYSSISNQIDFATKEEAEAGENNSKVMTALRSKELIAALKNKPNGIAGTDTENKISPELLPDNLMTYGDGEIGNVIPTDADTLSGKSLEQIENGMKSYADTKANKVHDHTADDVKFSDGKTFQQKCDTGELTGPPGVAGLKGNTGATGPQGSPTTVNGKSGADISLTAEDVGALSSAVYDPQGLKEDVFQYADNVYVAVSGTIQNVSGRLVDHCLDMRNPHEVTAKQTGAATVDLSNVPFHVMQDYVNSIVNAASIDFAATTGDNTLHLRKQLGGYDCTIHWGDGQATKAPPDGGNVVHDYANGGTYNILITGKSFAGFYVDNQTGREKYVALHSMGKWEVDTAKDFGRCFCGCTSLTTLPPDLFKYNTAVTDFYACFFGCTGLTTLPSDLFKHNTAAMNFGYCFYECTGLTRLPPGLFAYNTAAEYFGYCFRDCTSLTLRGDIFGTDYERFTMTQYGAYTNFDNCFYRTSFTGVRGVAPELWRFTGLAGDREGCFGGAGNYEKSISNYQDIPADWK